MKDPFAATPARWGIALALIVMAAVPRMGRLGEASLTGDEDFTWLAATAVAEGRGSVMPSGMPYRRALPFTWANAAAVSLMGAGDNRSVRVVAAAAGSVTPGVVFLAGSRMVAPPVALVGAVLIAVSEWHVARSRHGRMYPLLALTFFLGGVVFWRWAREGGVGLGTLAVALLGLTVALHLLGLPVAQTALLAIVLPGALAVSPWLIAGVVAASTFVVLRLNQYVVQAPYGEWSLPAGFSLDAGTDLSPGAVATLADHEPNLAMAGLGIALGLWWAARAPAPEARGARGVFQWAAHSGALLVVSVAVTQGLLVGALLATVVALLLSPATPRRLLGAERLPLAVLCAIGTGWVVHALAASGPGSGLRRLASVPYVYLRSLWGVSPSLVVLFVVGTLGLIWSGAGQGVGSGHESAEDRGGLRAAALAAWLPIIGLGLVRPHGPARYAFMLLPFIALVAAWPLTVLGQMLVQRWRSDGGGVLAPALTVALVLVGIVPGLGLSSALRGAHTDHGATGDPLAVDHETPLLHLAAVLQPGDVVIAEDETMTRVYLGRVDYWFRRAADARNFLYLGPDGTPRSKYTGARLVSSPGQIDEILRTNPRRVWFVTSREAAAAPRFYHSAEQAAWLARLRSDREPVAIGLDGVTAVYCLDC